MSSLMWVIDGFGSGGSPPTGFKSYNNDSGLWTTYSGWPDAVIGTIDATKRQQGAWDGTYWYVIGSDGKLYRMLGSNQTWSAALISGAAFFTSATANAHHWVMSSDGRFIYILLDGTDFRRYDPVADTLQVMALPPLSGSPGNANCFLAYDGVDTIYARGNDSGTTRNFVKYTISSNTWASLTALTFGNNGTWVGATCLQGKLWLLWYDNANINVFQYDPSNTTWTTKAVQLSGGIFGSVPYGEDTDGTIRLWKNGTTTYVYTLGSNTWTTVGGSPIDYSANMGMNWAITRIFTPAYTFYQSDGVTLLGPNFNEGAGVIGQVISHQIKVKTPVSVGGGATVSVVNLLSTDADDAVTISATSNGSYTTSFVTSALSANQLFDVFIKVTPTAQQTSGAAKNWNLRVV